MKIFRYIILSFFAIALMGMNANAKNTESRAVDFDYVKSVTQNPDSRYYYPSLMQRYQSNTDTTMVLEDYRNFYYGYLFQEDYNPYRQSVYSDKVEQLNLVYEKTHTRAQCDSIEKYAVLSLNDNIFDFDQMEYYIYVLKEKRKYARSAVRFNKLERLIQAIMSSGKGTKEEPWEVICPAHEYYILNALGFIATHQEELEGGIDHITVQKQEGRQTDFYFNISHMLKEAARKGYDQ